MVEVHGHIMMTRANDLWLNTYRYPVVVGRKFTIGNAIGAHNTNVAVSIVARKIFVYEYFPMDVRCNTRILGRLDRCNVLRNSKPLLSFWSINYFLWHLPQARKEQQKILQSEAEEL